MEKQKPFEIIYTDKVYGLEKGKRYANPRHFSTPRAKATKVYLDGDWPNVEAAYKAADVPVEHLGAEAALSEAAETDKGKPTLTIGKGRRGKFYIKDGTKVHSGPFETEDDAKAALAKELGA